LFTKQGWQDIKSQRFVCTDCGHKFLDMKCEKIGMFEIKMIEYAAYMYLRAVSFNSILDILRAWFEKDVLSKDILIDHIEQLADKIPDQYTISKKLKPKRFGYYALDGTWFKYRGRDMVLLILFDVKSLDLVSWKVALDETEDSYKTLIRRALPEIQDNIKGVFCDGDPGLLKAIRSFFPKVDIQLCAFHKLSRVAQIVPFKRPKTEIDKELKTMTEAIIYAETKQEAIKELNRLKVYAQKHQADEKMQKALGVLKRNFDLLLTHFDHEAMSPYNNVLEGFNHVIKRRTRLMKGFKKPINIERWFKLILHDWRFHRLKETVFKERRGKSPLELAGCKLPKLHNWIGYARTEIPT
jgi:transposase-like protein